MRIRISHETRYRYDAPINGVIQTLRLTPRNHDGQYVIHWRIDVTEDCRLDVHEDAFGNITHTFTAEGPFDVLGVQVEGEIDVQDTGGIVRNAIERFPRASIYVPPRSPKPTAQLPTSRAKRGAAATIRWLSCTRCSVAFTAR